MTAKLDAAVDFERFVVLKPLDSRCGVAIGFALCKDTRQARAKRGWYVPNRAV